MTEDYINVYGGYAIKLLRLQNEMIQTFERYRRGLSSAYSDMTCAASDNRGLC